MAWPFKPKLETKDHPSGGSFFVSQPVSWSRSGNAKAFVHEGYQMNVAVYRSVREITTGAVGIKVELFNGETQVDTHPVLDLLKRPNLMQSYGEWLCDTLTSRLLFGEMFNVATSEKDPLEIWPLSPPAMKVVPSKSGVPIAYVHEQGPSKTTYTVDRTTGQSVCMFSKLHNPDNYWRGQSPLMAASVAADTSNAGAKWNYSLLSNSARPSGLVKFKGDYPGQEKIARMREYFSKSIQGAENAGGIPLLSNDADWVPLSQTAKDMDFSETMKMTTKQIAAAFGVPLPLVDNDASTFNNLEQAKEKLYTDTIIPMMNEVLGALNRWLLPMFGIEGYELRLDLDSIPALEGLRQKMFDRSAAMYAAGILTREESRVLIGYDEVGSGTFKESGLDVPLDDVKALAYGFNMETKHD